MEDHPWLEAFRARLREQALPSWYVRRLVRELGDHLTDVREHELMDESRGESTTMGDPATIARAVGAEFRRRSFFRRRPGFRSAAAASLAAGLLLFGGIVAGPALCGAEHYLARVRVERKNGTVIAAPQMFVVAGDEASCRFRDGATEFTLRLRTADGDATSNHVAELTTFSVDAQGKKTRLSAPRVTLPTNRECRIEHDALQFRLRIDPAPTTD